MCRPNCSDRFDKISTGIYHFLQLSVAQNSEDEIDTRKALLFVTGDRPNWETQIHSEVLDRFVKHLDNSGDVEKISLFLYTRGGNTLAAWSIVNLVRQFCNKLEVVVPSKAHSAGTLICLGADSIMMTKQATLGPIDPSVNGPLNPQIPGAPNSIRAPVSVEAINGFLSFAREGADIAVPALMKDVFLRLAEQVHPLVLGEVYRSRSQIRMLAGRLLTRQVKEEEKKERILQFLCSESGSHDYTIYRREARDELGLNIERPDESLYKQIKAIYDDFAADLQLGEPYSPEVVLGTNPEVQYRYKRALIESVEGGSHSFVSAGTLTRKQAQVAPGVTQMGVEDRRTLEGWIYESV
jgi:Serine dehydrogenase proteinase